VGPAGSTATYVYDAAGQRVRKTSSAGTVDYIYDLAGHEIAEVSSAGAWNRGEVYAGGRHLATYDGGTTYFNHVDWLGTERARSSLAAMLCEQIVSLPFGDGQATNSANPPCVPSDPSPMHFTGKQWDAETNLDYFGARYDASSMGRFMTPDWAAKPTAVPYAMFGDPQSLNLYGYVRNNPLATADLDGHGDWYNPSGEHMGSDGVNDGSVHIANSVVKVGNIIDASGTYDIFYVSGHVGNAIQASVDRTLSPSTTSAGSDFKGGFHEEGFTVDSNGVHNAAPGAAFKPTDSEVHVSQTVTSDTTVVEHTHPSGTTDPNTYGGTHFNQDPSPGDRSIAGAEPNVTHIEAGAQDQTVRFYDRNGTQAKVPLSAFPRCQDNGQGCH